jgi:hypothetical protein
MKTAIRFSLLLLIGGAVIGEYFCSGLSVAIYANLP